MGRRKGKGESDSKTRERILVTAARLLQQLGYEGLSVEDIAEEANVSRVTFYKYFRGKADLIRAMVSRVVTRIESMIVPIKTVTEPEEVEKKVLSNMQRILDVFESSLPLFKLLFGGGRWTAGLEDDAVEALQQRMIDIIRNALIEGAKRSLIRPLDPDVSALTIWGSFYAAILRPLARGYISIAEARNRVPILVDYHVYGLRGAGAS